MFTQIHDSGGVSDTGLDMFYVRSTSLSQFDALLQDLENYRPLLLNDLAGVKSISKQASYNLFEKLSKNGLSRPVVQLLRSGEKSIPFTYH